MNGRTDRSSAVVASLLAGLVLAPEAGAQFGFRTLWSRQYGTIHSELVREIAALDDGSLLVGGVRYGQSAAAGLCPGCQQALLLRYDALGQLLWIRDYGEPGDVTEFIDGIAPLDQGGALIVGASEGSFFGGTSGLDDAFLAEVDATGAILWSRQFGTSDFDHALRVVFDGDAVFVVGGTQGSLGGANAGSEDFYLAKFSRAGEVAWIRQTGSTALDRALGLAVAPDGAVYVCGATLGAFASPHNGQNDAVLVKYGADGDLIWARQWGTTRNESAVRVVVDAAGSVYVTGFSPSTANPLDPQIALVKFSSEGLALWTREYGSSAPDFAGGMIVLPTQNVLLSGHVSGPAFGTHQGGSDVVLIEVDPAGDLVGARQFGTSASDHAGGLATAAGEFVYLVGVTGGAIAPVQVGGNGDTFVLKLGPPCPPDLTTIASPGLPGFGEPDGVLTPDDFVYYMIHFVAAQPTIADLTTGAIPGVPGYGVPDGAINNDDFFFYVTLFAQGC